MAKLLFTCAIVCGIFLAANALQCYQGLWIARIVGTCNAGETMCMKTGWGSLAKYSCATANITGNPSQALGCFNGTVLGSYTFDGGVCCFCGTDKCNGAMESTTISFAVVLASAAASVLFSSY